MTQTGDPIRSGRAHSIPGRFSGLRRRGLIYHPPVIIEFLTFRLAPGELAD